MWGLTIVALVSGSYSQSMRTSFTTKDGAWASGISGLDEVKIVEQVGEPEGFPCEDIR